MTVQNDQQGHLLELSNGGPIRDLAIPMPEPGLYELRGDHGEGKTTALMMLARANGEDVPVSLRDGASRGYLKLDGVTLLSIGKVNRLTGKAEVNLLSVSPLADFIEPGPKDHAAAERIRIQAALRLIDIPVTKDSILTLVQGDDGAFEYLDQQEGIDLLVRKDIVTAADKVRRLIHQQKQHWLREVDVASAEMTANSPERPEILVDLTVEEAEAAQVEAIRAFERVSGQAQQRATEEKRHVEIQSTLGERPDAAAADKKLAEVQESAEAAAQAREALKEQIRQVEAQLFELNGKLDRALTLEDERSVDVREAAEACRAADKAVAEWERRKAILEQPITGPTPADVERAELLADSARADLAQARNSDAYRRRLAARDAAEAKRREAEVLAKRFGDIAVNVTGKLGVLLAQAGLPNLTVEGEELLVIKDDGSTEPVWRLSYAEKLQLAVGPYLQRHPDSIVSFPFEQYACLKPTKQKELAQAAAAHGLYILTEVPDEGPIRVRQVSIG